MPLRSRLLRRPHISTACSVTTCLLARAGPRHQLEIVGPDGGAVLGDEPDRDAGSVAASARDPWWLVGETMAEDGVADDQQCPAVADDLERASDRTDLAVVVPLQHGASIATLTCVTQVSSCTVACVK